MNDFNEIADLVKAPDRLVELCRKVIEQIEFGLSDPKFEEKETQLREIAKAVAKLEKLDVPVPDALRAEKTRLVAELADKSQIKQTLIHLCDELETVVKELNMRFGRAGDQSPNRKIRKMRSSLPRTSGDTLRGHIIEALKKFGGRAKLADVFKEIEKQLEDKFLPGDLELREDRKTIVWKNNVQWERLKMTRDGTLRNDSPNGIWELSEEDRG
jgi:hypothetical protein